MSLYLYKFEFLYQRYRLILFNSANMEKNLNSWQCTVHVTIYLPLKRNVCGSSSEKNPFFPFTIECFKKSLIRISLEMSLYF